MLLCDTATKSSWTGGGEKYPSQEGTGSNPQSGSVPIEESTHYS